jgi:hypothetical protein
MEGVPVDAVPRAVSLPDDLLIAYSPPMEDATIPDADAIAQAARETVAAGDSTCNASI